MEAQDRVFRGNYTLNQLSINIKHVSRDKTLERAMGRTRSRAFTTRSKSEGALNHASQAGPTYKMTVRSACAVIFTICNDTRIVRHA